MTEPLHRSPIYAELDRLGATWKTVSRRQFAVYLARGAQDETVVRELAICDISGLPSWTAKGAGAEAWLRQNQVTVPSEIYANYADKTSGIRVIRTGNDEFLVELAPHCKPPAWVIPPDKQSDEFVMFERQDAVFLLTGRRACEVLAQTCGINWNEISTDTLVMTRVAGVSGGIIPSFQQEIPWFQIRCDGTYAIYLWGQLVTICNELDGQVAGTQLVCPEWCDE